jgi:uncharacterized protein (DUF924 family)
MGPEDIHEFWFADALADPEKATQRMQFWFRSDRQTDALIARRFAPALREAAADFLADWEQQPRSCLALIIVLDQFPRNIWRGTAAAFQHDPQALGVARQGVAAGHVRALHTVERTFFLMPFQHAEDLASQREGIVLFQQTVEQAPAGWRAFAQGIFDYAQRHLRIIERFGRFPHRNAILRRASTAAEEEFLKSNAETFGQSASRSCS